MKLQPSKYMLMYHDGQILLRRLWEVVDQGDLVWTQQGVWGSKPPAGMASGRVPCKWVESAPEMPLIIDAGGVVRGTHIEVQPTTGKERLLIVRAPDGLLELKPVMTHEDLQLA